MSTTIRVTNDEVFTLLSGMCVYIGAAISGGAINPKVHAANSAVIEKSDYFGTVVSNILSGQEGFVQVDGIIRIPPALQDGAPWASGSIISISSAEEVFGHYMATVPAFWGRVGNLLNDPGSGDAFVFINRVVPTLGGG